MLWMQHSQIKKNYIFEFWQEQKKINKKQILNSEADMNDEAQNRLIKIDIVSIIVIKYW